MTDITICVSRIERTSASEAAVRDHRVVMDRPESKGGGNAGAMGGEMLLASFGGCFMSNLIAAAENRELSPTALAATVTGTLEGQPTRFTRIALEVTYRGVTSEEMKKLVQIAEKGCIVRNTLSGSVEISVSLAS